MNRQEIGRRVAERRQDLRLDVADVARIANVDRKTHTALEKGERWPRDSSRAKIEAALQWETGALDRLASDLEPIPVDNLAAVDDAGDELFFIEDVSPHQAARRPDDMVLHGAPPPDVGEDVGAINERVVAQGWADIQDLVGAVLETEEPSEHLLAAARQIVNTVCGDLIIRILNSGNPAHFEQWLARIYNGRERMYRDLSVGEPTFPWYDDGTSNEEQAAEVARQWAPTTKQENDDDLTQEPTTTPSSTEAKGEKTGAGSPRGKADDLIPAAQDSGVDANTAPDDYDLAGRDTGGISEAEYIRRQQERDAELGEL